MVRCPSLSTRSFFGSTSAVSDSTSTVRTTDTFAFDESTLHNSSSSNHAACGASTPKKGSARKRRVKDQRDNKVVKARHKAHVSVKTRFIQDQAHVFVGNFPPEITEDDLHQLFRSCGTITHLSISCCGGLLLPRGKVDPEYYRGHLVQQRAIVRFTKAKYADKAVALDGRRLRDSKLVVTRIPYVLPEFVYKFQQSSIAHFERHAGSITPKGRSTQPRRTRISRPQPTELIENEHAKEIGNAESHGFRIFGFSFPQTLYNLVTRAFPL